MLENYVAPKDNDYYVAIAGWSARDQWNLANVGVDYRSDRRRYYGFGVAVAVAVVVIVAGTRKKGDCRQCAVKKYSGYFHEICFEDHRFFDCRRWKLFEGKTPASEKNLPRYQQIYNLYGVYFLQ